MELNIVNSIEKLKPHTDSRITAFQAAKSPTLYDLRFEQKWSFEPDGKWHSLWQEDTLLFIVNNLPFIYDKLPPTYFESLDKLIVDGILHPFILFVNNKFVKWSEVFIIGDYKYTYIMIVNTEYEYGNLDCVLLPLTISYKEGASLSDVYSGMTHFIFDKDNKLVQEASARPEYTIINFTPRDDLFYETFELVEHKRQNSSLNTKYKLSKSNIILFQDGLLYKGAIELHGLNVFSVDNNIFTFPVYAKIFHFIKGNASLDNIQMIPNKSYLRNKLINSANIDEYIKRLNIPFDFEFHREWTYEQNITHALQCIMIYNSSLMDDLYASTSNIISRLYSGIRLKRLRDNSNNVTFSRKIGNQIDNYVIIFLNGELYKYNNLVCYKNKDFIFPIGNEIKDNDIFEFLFFTNIDNRVYKIFNNSNNPNSLHYVNNVMNTEDIEIFSEDLPTSTFRISRTNRVEFKVEHSCEKVDDDHIKLNITDPFYQDKDITLTSKKQFHTIYKRIKNPTVSIKLPREFTYCTNEDNYLIFINHRKIDRADYKITVPTATRPFDDLTIFLNTQLNQGDEFEAFYIGYGLNENTLTPFIPINGNILLDREKLGYGFNKYLYLVFLNGKKINPNDITNIDSKRLMINNDQKTIKNLTIIKHIPNIDTLSSIFNINQDEMTNIMDMVSEPELKTLYNQSVSLNNTEQDIKVNNIGWKPLLYEIIRKYWMRPGVMEQGDPFIYDFDNPELLDELDPVDTRLVPYNGNKEDYIKNNGFN